MALMNQQIHLVSRPTGEASVDNFRLVEVPVPELADGQVLVRHHYLSLDPYMRMRMVETKSYAAPQPLNATMIGGTVGEVVASKHEKFAVGDRVVGMGGWQLYSVVDGGAAGTAEVTFTKTDRPGGSLKVTKAGSVLFDGALPSEVIIEEGRPQ